MPVAVKPEEVPTFTRDTVSQYAEIFQYQTTLLADPKRATKEAVAYTAEDGVTKENWGQVASGLRAVGKTMGVKLAIVFKPGDAKGKRKVTIDGVEKSIDNYPDCKLFVKHNGDYVALTPEQVEARKQKRIANKIAKLTEQYKGEGMTEEQARKRATAEVHSSPVN